MSETVPCLACGTPYVRQYMTRHFCDVHQEAERKRLNAIEQAERDAIERHVKQYTLEEFERVTARTPHDMNLADAEEFLDTIDMDDGDEVPLVMDDKPRGWLSPRGPEQGASTYFTDLDLDLYGWDGYGGMLEDAVNDPWWERNPHWNYELDEPEAAVRMAKWAAEPKACGDEKGSVAGARRHSRAGEMLCYECSSAKLAYQRDYYTNSKPA